MGPKIIFIGDGFFEKAVNSVMRDIQYNGIPGYGEMRSTFNNVQSFIATYKEASKLIVWDLSGILTSKVAETVRRQLEGPWKGLNIVLTAKPEKLGEIKKVSLPEIKVLSYAEITIDKIKTLLPQRTIFMKG